MKNSKKYWLYAAGAVLLLAAAAAGIWVLRRYAPSEIPFPMPVCLINRISGLHCPGCGITRMAHFILNGHFYAAFRMNPLIFILIPCVAGYLGYLLYCRLRGKPAPELPEWLIWGMLVLFVLYGVLRNLPFAPFSALAPTYVA